MSSFRCKVNNRETICQVKAFVAPPRSNFVTSTPPVASRRRRDGTLNMEKDTLRSQSLSTRVLRHKTDLFFTMAPRRDLDESRAA